jgi:hypothetical protein
MAFNGQDGARGRDLSGGVRLRNASANDAIGACFDRFGKAEFKLPDFVAPER